VLDLARLTGGEELLLWRFRRRSWSGKSTGRGGSCVSQAEAASTLSVAPTLYWRAEKDRAEARDLEYVLARARFSSGTWTLPSLGELCRIARRRAGLTLAQASTAVGISKPLYLRAEAAGDPRVVALWRARGFAFPASLVSAA